MNFIELAICNGSSMADDRNANNKTKITAEGPVFRSETPINILIVDDEPRNLTALETILDDPGYRLVRADSAEQALLSLLVDEFALLVLDIRMPAVTGLELAQMIRARKKTANVPIIFLTAYYGDDQDVVEGYEAGGIDYVRKPVNPAILRSKVGLFAELYRKQRKLEETNRVLAAVVESCDDAIISTDLAGIVATFNPGAERLFGYKAEEVVGKPVTILIPPDRQHEEPEILARIRRGERLDQYETVRRRKNGTLVDVSLTVSPVKDDQGRVIGASKIARDITERKAMQASLRQREQAAQYLAAIVESSDDAIISKDLNGIIATFNRGAERLFGYKAEEVVGKPVTILIPPDRQHEEPEILARIRRGERLDHYETVRRRKNGTLVDISLTVSPVKDDQGRVIGASKIARDITERKRADAKVRDSERQLQELITAIPAAIYTTDADGKITYFNQAAVELAGRTPTIGSDEWCVTWKLYHPDGRPLAHDQCPMAIALKEGRPIRNAEAVAERPDGSRVPFIPYPTPLRDGAGKIVGAINMLVDVSERKQAETQQRVLLNELNHRVKNNMQMLQILLEAGARRAKSPDAREVLEEASGRVIAMAAAQRVLYTTHDATRFNARDFLGAVCESVKQTFPAELVIDHEADAVQLPNDAAMPLALIANELLTNAVKYGLNGQDAGTIRVRLKQEDNSLLFYVEDDGPGFDLQSVQRRSSGLALVQGLARQLRGKFEVTRTPATRCSVRFQ
jgi:PAS domain S-box-containing protein